MSRVPIGEKGGLNLYGYVGNRPVGTLDPLGLVTLNLLNSQDTLFEAANAYNAPNTLTIAAHGESNVVTDQRGSAVEELDPSEMITQHPAFKPGMRIELISCYTGYGDSPYAQSLANVLGVTVMAPNRLVGFTGGKRLYAITQTPVRFDLSPLPFSIPMIDLWAQFIEFEPE